MSISHSPWTACEVQQYSKSRYYTYIYDNYLQQKGIDRLTQGQMVRLTCSTVCINYCPINCHRGNSSALNLINLRPAGGGVWTPPCGFSRIARKRRRAAPPGFHQPYPPSFWQLLWKFRSWVMQGQVTRSGEVTIPYKNFTIAPQLQCLRESYENFGIW